MTVNGVKIQAALKLLLAACVFLICACANGKIRYEYGKESIPSVPYPDVSFAVISDIHLYDPSLGTSGAAFEAVLNSDRKLLLDSIDLLDFASEAIIARGKSTSPGTPGSKENKSVSFVLISGDLTKDGELVNHNLMAEKLKRFTENGISVYVVPGNHDINNPDAVRFEGEGATGVATVSAEDFKRIYGDFGFNSALMHDDNSLSYVAEPAEGLWLLAIDACRYRENKAGKGEIVSGKISKKTAKWITGVLKSAAENKKAVMAVMHHGVVEHWKGQSKLHPDYLIKGYGNFGKFLASWNVQFVFTGHYHAQDITKSQFGKKNIYDIETGSLVTAPCPIRYVEISDNVLRIQSETLVEKIHPGTFFAVNAHAFVKRTVMLEAMSVLKKFKVSDADSHLIADSVGDAFAAHYSGDENPALRPPSPSKELGLWGRFVYGRQKYVIEGLWEDLEPEDNDVRIHL